MRDACAQELTEMARSDSRVVILSGDIGNHMFDGFKTEFPDRFYNCGVAEANMISVAAGLAHSGLRPFVYTFAAFDIARCYEQIRIDLCFQNLPVVIIGLGGGLTYSALGPTHYICEDISILRCLPHMTVTCPSDRSEAMAVLRNTLSHNGPVYVRINKKNEPCIHHDLSDSTIGRSRVLQDGDDLCFITTGVILSEVMKASDILKKEGISAGVIHLHTIKPLDEQLLKTVISRYQMIVSVEEQSLIGGLGGMLAEWIIDNRISSGNFIRIGTRDEFLYHAYTQAEAREYFGLSGEMIAEKVRAELRR